MPYIDDIYKDIESAHKKYSGTPKKMINKLNLINQSIEIRLSDVKKQLDVSISNKQSEKEWRQKYYDITMLEKLYDYNLKSIDAVENAVQFTKMSNKDFNTYKKEVVSQLFDNEIDSVGDVSKPIKKVTLIMTNPNDNIISVVKQIKSDNFVVDVKKAKETTYGTGLYINYNNQTFPYQQNVDKDTLSKYLKIMTTDKEINLFYSPGCFHCVQFKPVFEKVMKQYNLPHRMYNVKEPQQPEVQSLISSFDGVPTTMINKDIHSGAMDEADLLKLLM